jgi:hypothetical protein
MENFSGTQIIMVIIIFIIAVIFVAEIYYYRMSVATLWGFWGVVIFSILYLLIIAGIVWCLWTGDYRDDATYWFSILFIWILIAGLVGLQFYGRSEKIKTCGGTETCEKSEY